MTRILIVEDHKDIRKLLRMTLEFEDVAVLEACNGDVAWALARDWEPDVVLLDVMMPGVLNGFDVCKLIKSDADLRNTRVVMLTARGGAEDQERARACGADDYLVKPFSTLQILKMLHAMEA